MTAARNSRDPAAEVRVPEAAMETRIPAKRNSAILDAEVVDTAHAVVAAHTVVTAGTIKQ